MISIDTGYDSETILNEMVRGCKSMEVSEKTFNLVTQIREKGVKVAIATNNVDAFSRWTVEALALNEMFDVVINSSDVGAFKKDKDESGKSKFFQSFLEQNKIGQWESVIYDDRPDKNDSIKSFGIEYVQVGEDRNLNQELEALLVTLEEEY